jgi:hypothetical protein
MTVEPDSIVPPAVSMGAGPLTREQLFRDIFLPLYPDDVGDLRADANPDKDPRPFAHLSQAAKLFQMGAEARLNSLIGASVATLALDGSDASVKRLSSVLNKELRDNLLQRGRAGTAENELFNFVVHGAAYVGECICKNHGGRWSARHPLWESVVQLDSNAGTAQLPVFHWWLRSLADEELGRHTLADRYRAHVERPCFDAGALLPIVADADRKLPRIKKVRYDVLYKHMKAHLPELKDLGADFPTAERFAQYDFKWLDFLLVGGGRSLVMYGQSAKGINLFWLTRAGFESALFIPCDAFPEPIVRRTEIAVARPKENTEAAAPSSVASVEVIQIHFAASEKPQVHEVLWWGP